MWLFSSADVGFVPAAPDRGAAATVFNALDLG
jgi:hypothetical protein